MEQNDNGFLFVTLKGEANPMEDQVYFALSRDGIHWEALNGGEPALVSGIGDKGVRDPFLLRAHDNSGFYLIATDLSMHLNPDWSRAVRAASQFIPALEVQLPFKFRHGSVLPLAKGECLRLSSAYKEAAAQSTDNAAFH